MVCGRKKACTHLLLLLLGFGLLALLAEPVLRLLELPLTRALLLCRRPLPLGLLALPFGPLALLPCSVFELGLPKLFELLLAFALLPGGFRLPFLGLGLGLLLLHLLLAVPLQSLLFLFLLGFACPSPVLVQGPLLARRPWRRDAPRWLRLRLRLWFRLRLRFRLRLWLRLGL